MKTRPSWLIFCIRLVRFDLSYNIVWVSCQNIEINKTFASISTSNRTKTITPVGINFSFTKRKSKRTKSKKKAHLCPRLNLDSDQKQTNTEQKFLKKVDLFILLKPYILVGFIIGIPTWPLPSTFLIRIGILIYIYGEFHKGIKL